MRFSQKHPGHTTLPQDSINFEKNDPASKEQSLQKPCAEHRYAFLSSRRFIKFCTWAYAFSVEYSLFKKKSQALRQTKCLSMRPEREWKCWLTLWETCSGGRQFLRTINAAGAGWIRQTLFIEVTAAEFLLKKRILHCRTFLRLCGTSSRHTFSNLGRHMYKECYSEAPTVHLFDNIRDNFEN